MNYFEWDEQKREENLKKHNVDLVDAREMFENSTPMLTALDRRQDYGEDRWIGIGLVKNRVMVVVFTERNAGVITRLISLRKAKKHEREQYERYLKNQLG